MSRNGRRFDEQTRAKLNQKLIAAGYESSEWRSVMLKHYGEDYEGMHERAKLRANEREKRHQTMASSFPGVGPRGASRLDRAVPGGVQLLLER
eukprot:2321542-Rhodomonas_salina.1